MPTFVYLFIFPKLIIAKIPHAQFNYRFEFQVNIAIGTFIAGATVEFIRVSIYDCIVKPNNFVTLQVKS